MISADAIADIHGIQISLPNRDSTSVQQYCGVCHGVLNIDEEPKKIKSEDDGDSILCSSSSIDSFPLPSGASAVGTVHPCGHLFHVSCFHNHNNKRLLKKPKKTETPKPQVEILDDELGACVEIKSSDEFEDSLTELTEEDFNECPTCKKRAFLFVERSSAAVQHSIPRPLVDASKLLTQPSDLEEDDDASDIMNYYSLGNVKSSFSEGGDQDDDLFVDTSENVKQSHSDTSTEYHDVQTIGSQMVAAATAAAAGIVAEHRDDQGSNNQKTPTGSSGDRQEEARTPGSNRSKCSARSFASASARSSTSARSRGSSNQKTPTESSDRRPDSTRSNGSAHSRGSRIPTEISTRRPDSTRSSSSAHSRGSTSRKTPTESSDRRPDSTRSSGSTRNRDDKVDNVDDAILALVPRSGRELLCFDSDAMPTTPSIMITPGSKQRRKINKKVRFFDELSSTLLACASDGSIPEEPEDTKLALIDYVYSEDGSDDDDDDDESDVFDLNDSDVHDEPQVRTPLQSNLSARYTSPQGQRTSTSLKKADTANLGKKSTTFPLASDSAEYGQDENGLNALANGLVIPASDSKTLLWNVSTYEEDDPMTPRNGGRVEKLQREIDSLRNQLIQSEQEKENVQRNLRRSRTRDLGGATSQATEISRLRIELETLRSQYDLRQEDFLSVEEELATTQIELENAVESHEQAKNKLRDELNKTNEELEDVKDELEIAQEDLDRATEALSSEKEELLANQSKCEEELRKNYEDKMDEMIAEKEELLAKQNESEEQARKEFEKKLEELASEKEELLAKQTKSHKELTKELEVQLEKLKGDLIESQTEVETKKIKLAACERQREEQAMSSKAAKEALIAEHDEQQKEKGIQLKKLQQDLSSIREEFEAARSEHESQLQKMQEELNNARGESAAAKSELSSCRKTLDQQTKTAAAEKEEIEEKCNERENSMKSEHESIMKRLCDVAEAAEAQLKGARNDFAATQDDLQKQIAKAEAQNVALITKHKEEIRIVKAEYGAKLEATHAKLAGQMQSFQVLESDIKEGHEHYGATISGLEAALSLEKKTNARLVAELEQRRNLSGLSSSELDADLEKHKKANLELLSQRDQLETQRDQLQSELEKQQRSSKDIRSLLDETTQKVEKSLVELQADFAEQTKAYATVQSQLSQTQKESQTVISDLESQLARQQQVNEGLEVELGKSQEQTKLSGGAIQVELEKQTLLAANLHSQLQQSQKANAALEEKLQSSMLEKQTTSSSIAEGQLTEAQGQPLSADAQPKEAKAISPEESQELTFLRNELESTRVGMEQLIANMHDSDREMIVLRKELNAAKDALAAATNDIDLQRTCTSLSTLSPTPYQSTDDSSCLHSLQDELMVVKKELEENMKELEEKNQFIQGQLSMPKGKLIEYVRTKEGELANTKKELAQTKMKLKSKSTTFALKVQETERELFQLSSMKETLLATMNDMAEKNQIITSQLDGAQAELVFLAETNEQLRKGANMQQPETRAQGQQKLPSERHRALAAKDLKFGSAFAFAAVFMGQWLSECAKAKFSLQNKSNSNQIPTASDPDVDDVPVISLEPPEIRA